jgi:hypothetical protein
MLKKGAPLEDALNHPVRTELVQMKEMRAEGFVEKVKEIINKLKMQIAK